MSSEKNNHTSDHDAVAASIVASLSGMKRPSDVNSVSSTESHGAPPQKVSKKNEDEEHDDEMRPDTNATVLKSDKDSEYDVNDITSRTLEPHPFFYYRDHSCEVDEDPLTPLTPLSRVPNFPAKMHSILSDPSLKDVVSWMPHGRSWKILKPREFEIRVIPVYFEHQKLSSFIRQANGWGFRRITQGNDRNSYYHELFLRGMPFLCKKMKRPGVNKKQSVDANHEPDLYAISEMHPLPKSSVITDHNLPPNLVAHDHNSALGVPPHGQVLNSNYAFASSRLDTNVASTNDALLRQQLEIDLLRRENNLLRQKINSQSHTLPSLSLPALQSPFAIAAADPSPSAAFMPTLLPPQGTNSLNLAERPLSAFQHITTNPTMIGGLNPVPRIDANSHLNDGATTGQFAAGFAAAQALNQSKIKSVVKQAFIVANAAAAVHAANDIERVNEQGDLMGDLQQFLR